VYFQNLKEKASMSQNEEKWTGKKDFLFFSSFSKPFSLLFFGEINQGKYRPISYHRNRKGKKRFFAFCSL